ncbi:hypothetical protein NVP1115B_68 [Vibrio phage 1.115.B._10N.222.49.B11]|nr:hypothetical protein NVP1115A_68 [Vibrio phage 1.115.A._10N.222.49.B11]AUR88614.1 hypothetical protein NVP1115B_68 [Vibrio phage 1.115.B._10N.222.49.B11]
MRLCGLRQDLHNLIEVDMATPMTKEEEIALLYRLIEKHYGFGLLMQFADLIQEGEEDE